MKREGGGAVLWSVQTLFSAGSTTGMTDGQLLEQFLAQQVPAAEAAFAALVARHGSMVWNVCRSVLFDSHAAEDAFQATFLILVRKARSIRRRETLGPWLHGVARRVAVRAKQSANRQRRREGQRMERKAGSTPDLTQQEAVAALHAEIDRLPARYRAAVVLCHLEGRTHAEAAGMLKCPTGTVSIRVARAREILRSRLTRRGLALSAAVSSTMLGHETATAALPSGLAEATIKAAVHLAAGKLAAGAVPASAAQLTEGVLRTMTLNKLAITAAGVLAAGVTSSAIILRAMGEPAVPSAPAGAPVASAVPGALPSPQDKKAESAPAQNEEAKIRARIQSINNLKQIALAMHNFAANNNQARFAPAAIRKDGKPLLSWRVAILPYLEQKALYDKFHLDEPWNSPHNKTLLNQMPAVYAPVISTDEPRGTTYYQVFTGPGALFEDPLGPRLQDVTDGTSNTILAVEAGTPVPWTKPEDLDYDKEKPLPNLGRLFGEGFNAAFADGAVRYLSTALNPQVLRSLITSRGGEVVTPDQLVAPEEKPDKD